MKKKEVMFYKLSDLKKLIKSMSGAEKKHFSQLFSSFRAPGAKPIYLQLFQALSKPKTELPEFDTQVSSQVYTTGKKRLFKNVMTSLRLFHQETSIEIMIQNYLSEIEILYNHNLPEQSLYILQKAYALTISYEKFGLLLQVLEWEGKLNIILDHPTRSIEAIAAEEQEVLCKLTQIMHLENIYNKARNRKRQHGYIKGKMKLELEAETLQAPGMVTYEQCASEKARFYFNFIHALYYWMTFNHTKAYQYSKNLPHPQMQIIVLNDYINGVLEHVASCVNLGQFTEGFATLKLANAYLLRQRLNQAHAFNVKMFYYESAYLLIMYNYMGDIRRLTHTIKKVEEGLVIYEEHLSAEMKQVLYGNLMNAYMGAGDVKMMDATWEKVFSRISKTVRHDINGDLYLFRLFSLLQSKVYEVLPSFALSASRYYSQTRESKVYFDLELKITGLLLKEQHFDQEPVRKSVLGNIKKILTDYINHLNGTQNFQEHYSRYTIWIDSIVKERPFYKEAALWYQRHVKSARVV